MIRYVIAAAMAAMIIYSTIAHAAPAHKQAAHPTRSAADKKPAWKECKKSMEEEWKKYLAEKEAASKAYAAVQKKELSRLHSSDLPFYLKQPRAPNDSEFILAANLAYYNKTVGAAYDRYQRADKEALARYDEAVNILLEAYGKAAEKSHIATQAQN